MKKKTLLLIGGAALALYLLTRKGGAAGGEISPSQDSSPAPVPITTMPDNPPIYNNVVSGGVVQTLYGGGTAWSTVPQINLNNLMQGILGQFPTPNLAPQQNPEGGIGLQNDVSKIFATYSYDAAVARIIGLLNEFKGGTNQNTQQMYSNFYYGTYYALGGK